MEIGIVASVLGVATFGTQVARSLYSICDDFRHAPRQIQRFARKVTYLSDALHQIRKTLRSDRESYNAKAEKRIMIIIRSCEQDFGEIETTINYRRSRRISWLFKKAKADELFRSLESQTSSLQVLTQGITLSKLLQEQQKSNHRAQNHDDELKNLVTSMENLARTNQDLLSELKTAERKAAGPPEPGPGLERERSNHWARPGSSTMPSHRSRSPVLKNGRPTEDPYPDTEPLGNSDIIQHSNASPEPADEKDFEEAPTDSRTSDALLQVIPWASRLTNNDPQDGEESNPERKTLARHQYPSHSQSAGVTMAPSAMVRFILQSYTLAPTSVVDKYLPSEPPKAPPSIPPRGRNIRFDPGSYVRSDDDDDSPATDSDYDGSASDMDRGPIIRYCHTTGEDINHKLEKAGEMFFRAFQRMRGSFLWMKGNDFEISCYSGSQVFYIFRLTARRIKNRSPYTFTRIGKGWVREEFLKLHHLPFCEVDGYYHVYEALNYEVAKELVILSAGSLQKRMVQYARSSGKELPSAPQDTSGLRYTPNLGIHNLPGIVNPLYPPVPPPRPISPLNGPWSPGGADGGHPYSAYDNPSPYTPYDNPFRRPMSYDDYPAYYDYTPPLNRSRARSRRYGPGAGEPYDSPNHAEPWDMPSHASEGALITGRVNSPRAPDVPPAHPIPPPARPGVPRDRRITPVGTTAMPGNKGFILPHSTAGNMKTAESKQEKQPSIKTPLQPTAESGSNDDSVDESEAGDDGDEHDTVGGKDGSDNERNADGEPPKRWW